MDWDKVIGKAVGAAGVILLIYIFVWAWRLAKRAGQKGIEVGKIALDLAKERIDGMSDSSEKYDEHYAQAYEELNSNSCNTASWARAFAQASGEIEKCKALYIKYRVEQLKHAQ